MHSMLLFVWIMIWSEVTRPGNKLACTNTDGITVASDWDASDMKAVQMERTRPSLNSYALQAKYNLIGNQVSLDERYLFTGI